MTPVGRVMLTVVCFLMGALLVTQFRTQSNIERVLLAESTQDQMSVIGSLYDSNSALREEVSRLSAQLDQYNREATQSDLLPMKEDMDRLAVASGTVAVFGPGVRLTVAAPLRAEDVLDLANELRNAGAEAMALNGFRIVEKTWYSSVTGGVSVGGTILASPFVFEAIGNAEGLRRALERTGGLLSLLANAYPSARISVETVDRIDLGASPRR